MKPTLVILAVCLLLLSCHKSTSDNQLLWQCDGSQQLDSATTATKLIGSWQLLQQRFPTSEVVMASKNVIVTFKDNFTFTVRENTIVTTQGTWKLASFSDNTWDLELSSFSPYLNGFISFCNNKLLLTDSWVDGADNLFESVK